MGTMLIQQRRGKGSPTFSAPSHRYFIDLKYSKFESAILGEVVDFVDDPSRHSIIAEILLESGEKVYNVAAEGLKVGDKISLGREGLRLSLGSVLPLSAVPDGTPVFNIELRPNDGGKIARTSGSSAYVVSHDEETGTVTIRLPSKAIRVLDGKCRVTVGVACGGGRLEKPFKKAGKKFFAMKAQNRYWPIVGETKKSAYDHPFGGRSFGKPTTVKRSTPPGRKVGHVAARSTGRSRVSAKLAKEKLKNQ